MSQRSGKKARLKFLRKALKQHGHAEKIVTDGLKSYPAAMRELGNLDRRIMGQWLNNRAENSHLPFRRRERVMQRFRRMKSLQKFASVHANVHNQFASRPYGSTLSATLSIDRLTRPPAKPLWLSGKALWPDTRLGLG